ncbi:MAG: O-antigen ligase family protein [Verrucomicrobia bacterium]|nr:O-antigen ligase family protein [Verrucomicrobiota bacterium]
MAEQPPSSAPSTPITHHLFAALAGAFISLGLLKFGTPVVLDSRIIAPTDVQEFIHHTWPVNWAYPILALFALAALGFFKWRKPQPAWPMIFLLVWLVWQFISGTQTVSNSLTSSTLKHFSAAAICFGIGYFSLARVKDLRLFWIVLLLGFILVLRVGLEQHFGGFERTRHYFYTYILPTLAEPPLDYIQKISTTRIFSTLFYPNSFAGAILLFLPISAFAGWQITRRFGQLPQLVMVSIILLAAGACLYWSGSKSGWLILLAMGLFFLLHTSIAKNAKMALVAAVFLIGVSGFTLKYLGFFQKGATSVTARFDYWKAAGQIFKENPILGTGPGTFSVVYARVKSADSEMARLCHNDYLEQASDSGLVGFIAFAVFILGSLAYLYRYRIQKGINLYFIVWLGLAGICVQGFSEFNFYIPGLAWPIFLLIGWLWAVTNRLDNAEAAHYAPEK